MDKINPILTNKKKIEELARTFNNAPSFRHICIDNFLESQFAEALQERFPPISTMHKHYNGINERKSEESDFSKLDSHFQKLRNFCSSSDFINWLEQITGIKQMVVPDDFRGAGIYQGGHGSFLDVHIDFNIHPLLKLQRRVNVLLFFNKHWADDWGGKLELWNNSVTSRIARFEPIFNRCIIFECSDISYHGYDIITAPDDVFRKSFYMYFYTPVHEHTKYHDTSFKLHPHMSLSKKIQTSFKEILKRTVKSGLKKFGMQALLDRLEK